MDQEKNAVIQKLTPDELLDVIGVTPADNVEGIHTALPWKSKAIGNQVRSLFGYQRILNAVGKDIFTFGPLAMAASWQSALLETVLRPIKASARLAVGASRNPDAIADVNGWIYKSYSRLLYTLTGFFIKDGRFDREKARMICTTEKGRAYLINYMQIQKHNNDQIQYIHLMAKPRQKFLKEILDKLKKE